MSSSSINISNYSPTSLKDSSSVLSKNTNSISRTTGTWYTIISKDITVQNNSANIDIAYQVGLSVATENCMILLLCDGSPVTALTPGSLSSRTASTTGFPAATINNECIGGFFLHTGVAAGIHTYTVQFTPLTTVTIGVERATSESSTTGRSCSFIKLVEL